MGITNKCNLDEDELLCEEVRKYPCLYDKNHIGYRDSLEKGNSWKKIDVALGYEKGTAGKKFLVLKKRFCRKRGSLKKTLASGADIGDISEAQHKFDDYSFMGWLAPYISQRKIQTNFPVDSKTTKDIDDCSNNEKVDQDIVSESSSDDHEDFVQKSVVSPKNILRKRKTEQSPYISAQKAKTFKERKLEKYKKDRSVCNEQDDIFGRMIALELSNFPEHIKHHVKHDINTIIYRYRMQCVSAPTMTSLSERFPTISTQSQLVMSPVAESQAFSTQSKLMPSVQKSSVESSQPSVQ